MAQKNASFFNPGVPPNLEHAALIREEALDWLETHHPGILSFPTREVLRLAAEPGRRWLISRLRARNIGNDQEFNLTDTADALAILFLRSRGVKFRDAVEAIARRKETGAEVEPRYGGVWNRLIIAAMDGLNRRLPARLLGSVVFTLLQDSVHHPNCLLIIKQDDKGGQSNLSSKARTVDHDFVYHSCLERPAPLCTVMSPTRELMFMPANQPPARSEITSRHFISLKISSQSKSYELMLGTMARSEVLQDDFSKQLVAGLLDIVFVHFEAFVQAQSASRLETPLEPESSSASDLQLWLITQLLIQVFPGGLCEISESTAGEQITRVLASSVAKPWQPSPLAPAKTLEMLSGYASRTGVPLVVEKVEYPWIEVIEGIDSEMRYLKSQTAGKKAPSSFSALALPVNSSSGHTLGSLYLLVPQITRSHLDVEVRVLSVFSRVIGETIERHRAAVYSADAASNIVTLKVVKPPRFKSTLQELLGRKVIELKANYFSEGDVRLPFLLISACNTDERSPTAVSNTLKKWMIETLCHMEWRSFVRSHWPGVGDNSNPEGFMGEVPGIGMMISLGNLVSKDALDAIRNAFPTAFNRSSPSNSPVKLVAWVLDVPAERILGAAKPEQLARLADEIENWAFDVATLVDDLSQTSDLAHEKGDWEAALKRIRQALQKPGAHKNSYLRRLGADCSLALGDWPSALKYASEAVALSGNELGAGLVRSKCLEGDAHLCLCEPLQAWELYAEVVRAFPAHPLPRYYRGQALLLMSRLLRVYEDEERRGQGINSGVGHQLDDIINLLTSGAMEDLTSAADLLGRWGLIPETYQYRNFHLVPTLMGQGSGYLLGRSPGPAASRLQSARRSFPKDDIFLREFLFAKCWEQGVHRRYAAFFLSKSWEPLRDRLQRDFGLGMKPDAG